MVLFLFKLGNFLFQLALIDLHMFLSGFFLVLLLGQQKGSPLKLSPKESQISRVAFLFEGVPTLEIALHLFNCLVEQTAHLLTFSVQNCLKVNLVWLWGNKLRFEGFG